MENAVVADGLAIEGVRIVQVAPSGTIELVCDRNASRFREGDVLLLNRGNPFEQPGILVTLELDDETSLLVSSDDPDVNWGTVLEQRTGWVLDQGLLDFSQFVLDALDQSGDTAIGRERVLPLLMGQTRPTMDVARYERAFARAEDWNLNDAQCEALAQAYATSLAYLIQGPPGTGKTLLAKAIAGEADAAFFSISGSDFVEMFVGVGASRVRDMFEQARKSTPCLIFIDEIDAVGRARGHGMGGGNDEREQTLNALLVEMDGFDTTEGIIIIAATNRPDVLDPALLRPGRFDRQVTVNLPDVRGREAILKVHAKNVKLEGGVDLSVIARGTPGFSGAELANLLNEAALIAASAGRKAIGMHELEEARDKVRWGRERRSLAMSEEEKRATAWHEAGHALVNVLLQHTHPLHKVTIIPRGRALGVTMSLPKEDVLNMRRKQAVDMITMIMAGRIAESLVIDDISSGASSDIQQATSIAKSMVMHWGMSEKLGHVLYGESQEYVFLGRDMMRSKDYSDETAELIDAEVKRFVEDGYNTAKRLIDENRDKLEIIANALLEYETLDGAQVEEIVKTGKFTPPPADSTKIDPPSGAQAATPLPEVIKPVPPKLPGFGSPAPAAA